MCQQFLHLLLFGGQAHPPNYCVPVLRQVSSQSMTTAWDLMYARVKRICNFWESGEWVSEAQETIPCVLLTLVAGGRVGPGRAAVSTEPCVTMGSLYKQCWLLHAKKKKKCSKEFLARCHAALSVSWLPHSSCVIMFIYKCWLWFSTPEKGDVI